MDQLFNAGKEFLQSQQGGNNQGGGGGNYGDDNQGGYGGNQGGGNYGGNQGGGNYGDDDRRGGGGGYGDHQGSGGGEFGVQGGAHLNRPAGNNSFGRGGQGRDSDGDGIPDLEEAARHANNESGDAGDASLFSSALGAIKGSNHQAPIDEQAATEAHQQAYNGNAQNLDANGLGMAAALQALKQFQGGNSGGGGGSQSQLVGAAMAQAAKLFESSGGGAGGSKQDAVSSAGQTVMKMLIQSKMQSAIGGGNSGGLSGLMGMASKFM